MTGVLIGDIDAGTVIPPLVFRVTATRLIAGALAGRDYSPLHHDRTYVVNVAGQRDIFANTQFQAALFERYLNDWSGPLGRVARLRFAMRSSIFAGDEVTVSGVVHTAATDAPCGAAVTVDLAMAMGDKTVTTCEALYALPLYRGENPWDRSGADWLQPA